MFILNFFKLYVPFWELIHLFSSSLSFTTIVCSIDNRKMFEEYKEYKLGLEVIHIHTLIKILLDYKSEVSKLWSVVIAELLPIFVYPVSY